MEELLFKVSEGKSDADYGLFVIEPLTQGYGETLGTAIRRVLLTSIAGSAIAKIKIKNIRHQFATLPGLKEDIVELILNLKKVNFRLDGEKEAQLILSKKGPGEIRASDITLPPSVSIPNPNEYLGALANKDAKIEATIWIEQGKGYVPSEERKISEIGVIPVDSLFTPVRRVSYHVEQTRVGRATNFDKLTLEMWTNGAIKPKEALIEASKILVSYFQHIYEPKLLNTSASIVTTVPSAILQTTVEELDLPVRITNSLRMGGFKTLADFQGKKHEELEKVRNLGAKSITLIEKALKEKGIELAS